MRICPLTGIAPGHVLWSPGWGGSGCLEHALLTAYPRAKGPCSITRAHSRPLFTPHPTGHGKSYGQVQHQWGREIYFARRGRERGMNVCWIIIQTILYDKFNIWLVATWEEFWTPVRQDKKRCCCDQLMMSPTGTCSEESHLRSKWSELIQLSRWFKMT